MTHTNNQTKSDQPRAGKLEEETIEHFLTVIGNFADEDNGWYSKKSFKKAIKYTEDFIHTNYIPREEIENKVRKVFKATWEKMQDRVFEKTIKNKNSPFEVTGKEWKSSSFTVDEFIEKMIEKLKSFNK